MIADHPGHEETIERFCLSLFAKVEADYPPKPPVPIIGGLLMFESDWKPPLGEALQTALYKGAGDQRLNMRCVAAHGNFIYHPTPSAYEIQPENRPATAFLFEFIAQLQFSGTVPMIDIRAYAEWLAK